MLPPVCVQEMQCEIPAASEKGRLNTCRVVAFRIQYVDLGINQTMHILPSCMCVGEGSAVCAWECVLAFTCK